MVIPWVRPVRPSIVSVSFVMKKAEGPAIVEVAVVLLTKVDRLMVSPSIVGEN